MKIAVPLALFALFTCFILPSCSQDPAKKEREKRLQAIEIELTELTTKLHDTRLKEMNTEIEGQENFRQRGHDFVENMKEAEKSQHEEDRIQKRIQELLDQKRDLLKNK